MKLGGASTVVQPVIAMPITTLKPTDKILLNFLFPFYEGQKE